MFLLLLLLLLFFSLGFETSIKNKQENPTEIKKITHPPPQKKADYYGTCKKSHRLALRHHKNILNTQLPLILTEGVVANNPPRKQLLKNRYASYLHTSLLERKNHFSYLICIHTLVCFFCLFYFWIGRAHV